MGLKEAFQGVLLENRYRLTNYLAEGGFGAVFRADQEVLGHFVRRVAVKITKATGITMTQAGEILADAMILARVIDEIQDSAAKVFLVRIYDMGVLAEHQRRGFIVMEYIQGMSLATKLEHFKRLPKDTCLRYIRQICTGLAAMHNLEQPVIHRDLKPDNVLLTDSDEVRIVDFGLAARIERMHGYVEGAAGTEGYMSPETSVRSESSCASDVYSVGVMMYEMLTGVHPFKHLIPPPRLNEEQERQWIFEEKSRNNPPQPSRLNNTVDEGLDSVVMRCLKFNDYERYPNAAELLKALDKKGPEPPQKRLLAEGAELMQQKQWIQATGKFRKALEIQPQLKDETQFKLHYRLALALLEQRIWTDAIEQIRKAEDLDTIKCFLTTKKQRAEFYRAIAETCERNGHVVMARKYRNLEKQELSG
jgi:eukaryotic-like serine/threonine-protein kinase